MPELVIGLLFFVVTARYAGPGGSHRLSTLSDKRAKAVHNSFASRAIDWLMVVNIGVAIVNAGLAIYPAAWVWLTLSLAALGFTLAARAIRPRARVNVNSAFAERGLEPLLQREKSARRDRRQKQFGTVALVAYLSTQVLQVLAEQTNAMWPQIALAPVMIVMFAAGLALLWSMAWRFGDERPA